MDQGLGEQGCLRREVVQDQGGADSDDLGDVGDPGLTEARSAIAIAVAIRMSRRRLSVMLGRGLMR